MTVQLAHARVHQGSYLTFDCGKLELCPGAILAPVRNRSAQIENVPPTSHMEVVHWKACFFHTVSNPWMRPLADDFGLIVAGAYPI